MNSKSDNPAIQSLSPIGGDFSTANFNRFQDLLSREAGESSLLWTLRDSLFATIFNDTRPLRQVLRTKDGILLFPGGWIIWVILRVLHGIKHERDPAPHRVKADAHFLFLSSRSNHFQRIRPLVDEYAATMTCRGWITRREILPLFKNRETSTFPFIGEHWTAWVRISDLCTAAQQSSALKQILGARMGLLQLASSRLVIVKYLAWLRFWRNQFRGAPPALLLSTYEKDPISKAMFEAGREIGVKRRIHWAHSLRHGSLQATLATELWCMTQLDVDYFQPILPASCKALYHENPESAELIRTIGRFDPSELNSPNVRRFLFLGSGKDIAYTREQSEADMQVIRKAVDKLGDRVTWRFRPHPGNIPAFKSDLMAVGLGHIECSTRPLNEDLAWAQGIGSTFSSVLVDVEPTGRKIFWVHQQIRTLYGVDELIRGGFGIHLDSETIVSKLREALAIN